MAEFPIDAPIRDVIKTLERLGFVIAREGNHVSVARDNPDGSRTMLTIPNHRPLKSSTLRTILTQASIGRDEFLKEYRR